MIIDAHAHVGPTLINHGPRLPFSAVTGDDVIKVMDKNGIDIALLYAPLYEPGPYNDRDYYLANYATAEACHQHLKRLIGFARVDPNRRAAAVAEFRHCLDDYKMRGLFLHPDWESFFPSSQTLVWPLAELCAEYKVPMAVHTGYYPKCQPLLYVPLAEAFPSVPIYFKHLGYEYWRDAIIMARRYPNVYVETAGNSTAGEIMAAIRMAGADKVCYGSDLPYVDPQIVIKKIQHLPISDRERALVFAGNSARINGLSLPEANAAA